MTSHCAPRCPRPLPNPQPLPNPWPLPNPQLLPNSRPLPDPPRASSWLFRRALPLLPNLNGIQLLNRPPKHRRHLPLSPLIPIFRTFGTKHQAESMTQLINTSPPLSPTPSQKPSFNHHLPPKFPNNCCGKVNTQVSLDYPRRVLRALPLFLPPPIVQNSTPFSLGKKNRDMYLVASSLPPNHCHLWEASSRSPLLYRNLLQDKILLRSRKSVARLPLACLSMSRILTRGTLCQAFSDTRQSSSVPTTRSFSPSLRSLTRVGDDGTRNVNGRTRRRMTRAAWTATTKTRAGTTTNPADRRRSTIARVLVTVPSLAAPEQGALRLRRPARPRSIVLVAFRPSPSRRAARACR